MICLNLLLGWDLGYSALLIALGIWYFQKAKNRVKKWRRFLFGFGLGLAAAVLVGPIAHGAVSMFWLHMVQHIALMMAISPLLVLGGPITVALGDPKSARLIRVVAPYISFLFKPATGFAIFLAALITTHFSPLANAAMNNSTLHQVELLIFLFAGLIYYYPVMSGNPTPFHVPHPIRVASLFAMMVPETMTGFFLYASNSLLHDSPHAHLLSSSATTPLDDQRLGGALMWSMGMIIDTVWVVLAAKDWFAAERLEQVGEDSNFLLKD